jgi:hypothetical protein
MTNIDDLRDQLERLGRRPVPMPRPEFADKLLRDLQSGETSTDVLPMPTPIGSRERRKRVPARLVAMGSIAAALVLVIGLIGLTGRGGPKQDMSFSFESVDATPIGSNTVDDVKVDERGTVLGEGVQDGLATAKCQKGGQFKDAAGQVYTCAEGETWEIRIKDRRIIEARKLQATTTQVAAVQTEVPATTAAPQTTTASSTTTLPTTATTSSSSATSAVPPSSTTKPTPAEGAPQPTTTTAGNLAMRFLAEPGDKQIDFSWTQFAGANFGRYVMVRSTGLTITFPITGESEEIWSSEDVGSVLYKETELPLDADVARYQLFVVDKDDKVLAQSEVVKVELSLGPSTSSPSEPVTTVTIPEPTSTTSASTGSTS